MSENFTSDEILYGKLKLLQPENSVRVNMDTILLASWVKVRSGRSRFLEAGCATGAISLMLAMKFKKNFHITGIEIQHDLIELAKINAKNNFLDDRVDFIEGDLRDKNLLQREYFDGLVINPPYSSINAARKSHDASRSNARIELTCTPEDVAELSSRILKSKGRLFAVFTSERLDIFLNSMRSKKIIPKKIRPVYPDINHKSGIFLIECIKDGGEGMILLPPLLVRDENNNYTQELLENYK